MTSPSNDNLPAAANSVTCPICDKPAGDEYKPFCSKRCSDVDLHRWLSGRYAIPAVEDDGAGDGGEDY